MTAVDGLWLSLGGGRLAEVIAASIERHGQFTTTVVTTEVRPRSAEVVLVSMDESTVDFVGISQLGRQVATGQVTLVVSHLISLDGISIDTIRKLLPPRQARSLDTGYVGANRVSPRLWEELLKAVLAAKPNVGVDFSALNTLIVESRVPRTRADSELEAFERDAIAAALQTWRGTSGRKRIMRSVGPAHPSTVAPFLSRLRNASVREDLHINHDHSIFPGMSVARRDIVGSILLSDGDEHLTILNCNRQPLERTLGVDLIYYSHRFKSFVLVQYKRMRATGGGRPEYRPSADKNYAKELQRMTSTEKRLMERSASVDNSTDGFRLSERPFYFKLCEPTTHSPLDVGMIPGMYIPLGLWRRLLRAPAVRGPRGGRAITWDNCERRLNNGDFTSLLRSGWIGSTAAQSQLLGEIIEIVLRNSRMLVMAASSPAAPSKDHRRDSLGRFARDDDPASST